MSTRMLVLRRTAEVVIVAAWGPDRGERGRAALRRAAVEASGCAPSSIALGSTVCPDCHREHGAPWAEAEGRRVPVSLAHSGETSVAAAAVSNTTGAAAVGIDLVRADAVGTATAPPVWARVEAVLKADGRGLRVEPGRIRFDDAGAELDGRRYRVEVVEFDAFVIAVALGEERLGEKRLTAARPGTPGVVG